MAELAKSGSETTERNARKTRVGMVVSDKMTKTVVVSIERRVQHPVYGKMVRRTKKLKAHDEENAAKTGDTVRIKELEEEQFRLKFRGATEPLEDPLRLRVIRRDIARLKTIQREKTNG
jgi:small subunit ribosomal protein S17